MPMWEYKFFEDYGGNDGYSYEFPLGVAGQGKITQLGSQGWELVGFLPFNGKHIFVFKRPICRM